MAYPCAQFHTNPTVNPRSGRRIDIAGPTYRALVKECGPPPTIPTTNIKFAPYVQPTFNVPKPVVTPNVNQPVFPIVPKPVVTTNINQGIPIVPKRVVTPNINQGIPIIPKPVVTPNLPVIAPTIPKPVVTPNVNQPVFPIVPKPVVTPNINQGIPIVPKRVVTPNLPVIGPTIPVVGPNVPVVVPNIPVQPTTPITIIPAITPKIQSPVTINQTAAVIIPTPTVLLDINNLPTFGQTQTIKPASPKREQAVAITTLQMQPTVPRVALPRREPVVPVIATQTQPVITTLPRIPSPRRTVQTTTTGVGQQTITIPRIPTVTTARSPVIPTTTQQIPTIQQILTQPTVTPVTPVPTIPPIRQGTTIPVIQQQNVLPALRQVPVVQQVPTLPPIRHGCPIPLTQPVVTSPPNIIGTGTALLVGEPTGVWGVAKQQQRASEDRYQTKQIGPYRYFAVFDGHGGPQKMGPNHVGDYAVNHLHEKIAEYLANVNLNDQKEVILQVSRALVDLDEEMHANNLLYGSTCTLVLIDNQRNIIYQVNLGDSRSIIFDDAGTIISATIDHEPNNTIETTRIEAAGGEVFDNRVVGYLAVARAFGDFDLKGVPGKNINYDPIDGMVSAVPDIIVTDIKRPMNIILTSDAPYERDAFTDESLVELFRETVRQNPMDNNVNANAIAAAMVNTIYPRTTDDTTIMVVSV